ncbi:ABC transporter substrate-binding protein [Paraburkholderia atlantica]|uniref:ABC transporter substrate-binding protein n=1 Tax=Paraburkholderia atlantica TaxID=2654982 RepID=UPI0022393C1B|nr:ABC transporter substrate-binding protein [Paraburkholderia atlantica]
MLRAVSAIGFALTTFAGHQAMAAQEPLKIGFVAELSGPQAPLGEDQYAGFMLRVDMNGGKLGGVPVQVLREDSQLKAEVAAQVTQKLIQKDGVQIITGLTFSPMAAATVKVATQNKVFVVISNGTTNAMAGEECSPYQYITSWQPELLSATLAHYANNKGYKHISLMAPNYASGKNFLATFKHIFKGQVLDEIYTPLSQQDFSAEILQVSASKPDAVFVFYPGGLGINFVRQYQQAGLGKTNPAVDAWRS